MNHLKKKGVENMLYPPVYKKVFGVPFASGKIREKSFYKIVTSTNDFVFLFFIDTVMGCSMQGYYAYVSKERFDDLLEKAFDMKNLFMSETKGSRRNITISKDDTTRERNAFAYVSLPDMECELHLCQTYLSESSFLHQPVLPMKKKM